MHVITDILKRGHEFVIIDTHFEFCQLESSVRQSHAWCHYDSEDVKCWFHSPNVLEPRISIQYLHINVQRRNFECFTLCLQYSNSCSKYKQTPL